MKATLHCNGSQPFESCDATKMDLAKFCSYGHLFTRRTECWIVYVFYLGETKKCVHFTRISRHKIWFAKKGYLCPD